MFVQTGKLVVVLALVASLGAHWAALQTVAWTTMLANNLRSDSIAGAVSKTFDGEHLCCLCKAIAAAKKSEQKSEAVAPALKFEFPPCVATSRPARPVKFTIVPLQNTFADAIPHPPLTPPPRPLFV